MTNLMMSIGSVTISRWLAVGWLRFMGGMPVFVTGFGGGNWKERQQQPEQ
nr:MULTISPECIES: hypothetical protein [Skermanella]